MKGCWVLQDLQTLPCRGLQQGLHLLFVSVLLLVLTSLYAQHDPCQRCVTVLRSSVGCPTDTTGILQWTLTVRNDSNFPITYLFFLQGPTGVQVGPNPYVFNPPLQPGETRTIQFSIGGQYLGYNQLCFDMVFYNATLDRCCRLQHCVKLPRCCFVIRNESLYCDPHTGDYIYTFTIFNQFPAIVQYVVFVSDTPGVTVSPPIVYLSPPIGYLGTAQVTVRISGAVAGQTVRLRIGLLDFLGGFCCSIQHEITMPPCCLEVLEPRTICTEDGIFYEFTLQSWVSTPICFVALFPLTQGAVIVPNQFVLNPPLNFGESRRLRVRVFGAPCGGQVCMQIVLLDCLFRHCCSRSVCFDIPRAPILRTWTTTEHFEQGSFIDNLDTSNDELKLKQQPEFNYPYVWVTNYLHGTVSKIDARTYKEVARYRVLPEGLAGTSRTTVDRFGNVWVECRANNTVVQILDTPNWNPTDFDYNGNGQLDTSRDINGDGCIDPNDPNELLPWGQDELVARVYDVSPYGVFPRALGIDQYGYLWIGLWNNRRLIQVDPNLPPAPYRPSIGGSVPPILESLPLPHGPYGMATAPNGYIYVASLGNFISEFCPGDPAVPGDAQVTQTVNAGGATTYGIAAGPDCTVWCADISNGRLIRWVPSQGQAGVSASNPSGGRDRGVAVALDGTVWTTLYASNQAAQWNPVNLTLMNIFNTCATQNLQSGMGITIGGQIVAVGFLSASPSVTFLDPVTGAIRGCVSCPGMSPYNYNDFTGYQLRYALNEGIWRTVYDGGCDNTVWGRLNWNAVVPPGTALEVRVRASNDQVNWSGALTVGNGEQFCLQGRYLEIEVRMRRLPRAGCQSEPCNEFITPVLYDLTARTLCECPPSGRVTGCVFHDANRNGQREPEEQALGGWAVVIRDAQGRQLTRYTNAQGEYLFENIPAGEYTLAEIIPPGWQPISPPEGQTDIQLSGNTSVRVSFANILVGDVNNDLCVDDSDLLMVLFAYGQTGENLPEDLDGNGIVDDSDLLLVLFHFGQNC